MKVLHVGFATAAVAFSLAGCQVSQVVPGAGQVSLSALALGPQESSVYPLEVGRTWIYQSVEVNDGGAPKAGLEQRFVVSQSVPGGAIIQRYYGNWAAPATLARVTSEGVVLSRYVASGPPATDSITILRFPLKVGESWPGRTLVGATERIEVKGLEQVKVPDGTFEAWHVQHQITYSIGGGDTLDYWYAPHMGMVRAIERATMLDGNTPHHYQVTASLASASVPAPAL